MATQLEQCKRGWGKEDRGFFTYLDDSADRASSGLEDVLHALAADGRLLGNGALNEVALSIGGNLAGNENVRACLNGLRLKRRNQESVIHHCL